MENKFLDLDQFKNSKRDVRKSVSGSTYVGDINKKGEPHGLGTHNSKSGKTYTGDWVNG